MRRSKLGLIFALALGVTAALLVWNYTQRLQTQVQQASEQAAAQARQEQVDVLVAGQDIPAHTKLTPDMLKVIKVAKPDRLPDALTQVADADGKTVQFPIASGEQILPSKFIVVQVDNGLSYVIPAGQRAVSVKVSEDVDAGGLIQPGDKVDVLGTFSKETMGKDMTAIILQNVEVLAIAQAYEGQPDSTAPTATDNVAGKLPNVPLAGGPTPTPVPPKPKTQPQAKTATLAVTPEEAERLILAQANGTLNLALRPAKDTSTVDLPEATLSQIMAPVQQPALQVLSVQFSPTTAKPGDTLKIQIAVKNTSNKPIQTQDPKPGFTYVQGQTYFSQNFPSQNGKWRVGVSYDGHPSAPFPYRWGLGGDLAPGATATITGYIKLTYDFQPTNFWVGAIQEPATVVQDNVGTTLITVTPTTQAVVSVDAANVRSGPDIASSVIEKLNYGTQVPILGQEKDWYQVKLPDGKVGFVAAGWIVAPGALPPPKQ